MQAYLRSLSAHFGIGNKPALFNGLAAAFGDADRGLAAAFGDAAARRANAIRPYNR